jgi:hypothetical protein
VFKDAILHDVSWPARWGSEILDVVDFREALTIEDITAYKEMEKLIQGRHAIVRPDIPQQVRGADYQLCPWCTIALCPENHSNHLICKCGASFCFICGKAAFDRPGGFNHWGHGGCPRYGKVGSGHERFRDGQYDNSEPHLVPLGRVYGIYLYANRDDEHYGKAYKDDTELCWETFNHKHDVFDRHGEKQPPFEVRRAIACYMFNTAMQEAAKTPHKGVTLKRLLDRNTGPITSAQRHDVSRALIPFNIRDRRNIWFAEELADDLISFRAGNELSIHSQGHYPFVLLSKPHLLGLLYLPIGGIFRMALEEHRMNALEWLSNTIATYNTNDDPNNLAPFGVLGPSDPSMQMLFSSLQERALILPYHHVTFQVFTERVLLVWILRHTVYFPLGMHFEIKEKWRVAFTSLEQRDFDRLELVPLQE